MKVGPDRCGTAEQIGTDWNRKTRLTDPKRRLMPVCPPPAHATCFVGVSQKLPGVSQKLPGMSHGHFLEPEVAAVLETERKVFAEARTAEARAQVPLTCRRPARQPAQR